MVESAVDTILPEEEVETSARSVGHDGDVGHDGGGPYVTAFEPAPGLVLAERYELIEPLGRGSSGWVWKVRHVVIRKHFAIKILAPRSGTLGDAAAVRMLREAKTLSSVEHQHVIAVTDFGYAQRGTPFIVMELLTGQPLRARLDEGPLAWTQARTWALQICDGVEAAHREGVIHRDLKPANLFVTAKDARIKVLDFGLAHMHDDLGAGAGRLTAAGEVFGTPATMSPEQIAGGDVDARSDLYSLGCVLYEMFGGRAPVRGAPAELLYQHVYAQPDPLRSIAPAEVPDEVCTIVDRCLAKRPGMRPQSISEVREVLDRPSVTRPFELRAPSRPPPAPASGTAWRRLLGASAAAGGLFALVAAGWPPPAQALRPVSVSVPIVRPTEIAVHGLHAELPVLERAVPKAPLPRSLRAPPRPRPASPRAASPQTPRSKRPVRPPATDERNADLKDPFPRR